MATYVSTGRTKHVTTTTANTADTVTLDKAYAVVEIINDDPTTGLYCVLARGAADAQFAVAAVAADGTNYVGPGAVRFMVDDDLYQGPGVAASPSKVSVIAAATLAGYHVIGHNSLPH